MHLLHVGLALCEEEVRPQFPVDQSEVLGLLLKKQDQGVIDRLEFQALMQLMGDDGPPLVKRSVPPRKESSHRVR
ncbi:hypothetical protein [Nocardiopsis sp. NPDC006832]|uniref:hypothetical protein n=1 Tax=Nocardiopsis sp. NPDC006832 TaxID=3157188 RepID=UPI0033CA71E3